MHFDEFRKEPFEQQHARPPTRPLASHVQPLASRNRFDGRPPRSRIEPGDEAQPRRQAANFPGAIGFDWFFAGDGGVPWLISWPRKKLITQQLPTSSSLWLPNYGSSGLGIPA